MRGMALLGSPDVANGMMCSRSAVRIGSPIASCGRTFRAIDDARRERFNSGKLGRGQGNGLAESEHERRGPIGGCNRRGDDVTRRTGGEHHPTASYAAASIRKDLRGWLEVRQRRLFLLGARV